MASIVGIHSSGGLIGQIIPLGMTGIAPPATLYCDGSAVSRTAYALLFAKVGVTWGAGDGSTTFNLPDGRGRALIGAGTGSGLTTRTTGQGSLTSLGEETHTLSNGEMPYHDHGGGTGYMSADHYHTCDYFQANGNDGGASGGGPGTFGKGVNAGTTTGYSSSNHYHAVNYDGGNVAHNNIQPSSVAQYAITYK
jgi:microcystin-dependent protein